MFGLTLREKVVEVIRQASVKKLYIYETGVRKSAVKLHENYGDVICADEVMVMVNDFKTETTQACTAYFQAVYDEVSNFISDYDEKAHLIFQFAPRFPAMLGLPDKMKKVYEENGIPAKSLFIIAYNSLTNQPFITDDVLKTAEKVGQYQTDLMKQVLYRN